VQPQPLSFHDPSLPPTPPMPAWLAVYCQCEKPVPEERATRHGAARTHCARCGLELPLRFGGLA
jgi:hypothetical protein